MEGSGQVHAPAALPRSKRSCCPFSMKLEGAHRGVCRFREEKNSCLYRKSHHICTFLMYTNYKVTQKNVIFSNGSCWFTLRYPPVLISTGIPTITVCLRLWGNSVTIPYVHSSSSSSHFHDNGKFQGGLLNAVRACSMYLSHELRTRLEQWF